MIMMMISREKREKVAEALLDRARNTTAHGIPNMIRAKSLKIVRFMWLIFTLTSWSYLGFVVYSFVSTFVKYEVDTKISVAYESESTFPAIDICNLNRFDGNKIRNYIEGILFYKNISVNQSASLREYVDEANRQINAFYEDLIQDQQYDMFSDGFRLKDMLISCEYQGKRCSESDFYLYHDFNYGNCFRFNGGDEIQVNMSGGEHTYNGTMVRKSTKPGWTNGLRLELYTGDLDYQQQFTYKTGIRLIVHNQSIMPFPVEDGIDVAVGMQTNVAVSRTFFKRLPFPYSDCIDNDFNDVSNHRYKSNIYLTKVKELINAGKVKEYQQSICMKACFQYYIIQKCSCYSISLRILHLANISTPLCSSNEQVDCLSWHETEFYNGDQIDTCYSMCPLECRSIDYVLQVSSSSNLIYILL